MSDLKVLKHGIFDNGKIIWIRIEHSDMEWLDMFRNEVSTNQYKYSLEDNNQQDINITDIVSEEIKQIFSTVYHEQYQLKNL